MKIVVLDGLTLNPGDLTWERLEKIGDLTVYDHTPSELIVERIGDADIIYTNKTPLSRETLKSVPNVKFIGVLATGYNVVDTAAAREFGMAVTNIPTYGTTAVAQFAFALLLELCHHVGEHSREVKNGAWAASRDFCFWNYPLVELADKTMGIIGFGRIGQATAKIANAMGMHVLIYDNKDCSDFISGDIKQADLDTLFGQSDVISLHCPLFDSTRGIINKANINKMKDGVMIINTSRGPLINEEDLVEALDSGKVAGAAVDVLSVEPPKGGNPLIKAKNCLVTPHIAWAPKEARERLLNIAVDNLEEFIKGKPVNVVNP